VTRQRLNVQEAAEVLGISVDAVRMRTRRGTLDSEHENGRLYIWLDTDSSNVHPQGQDEALLREKDERIEELREQVHHFREVLAEERDARRRADTIIAQLTQANAALAQRVPELEPPREQEAPQEPPGGPQSAAAGSVREEAPPAGDGAQEGVEARSWWRRVLGG
jgi:hypothetical protein